MTRLWTRCLCLMVAAVAAIPQQDDETKTLRTSTRGRYMGHTPFGDWGMPHRCSNGSRVNGFRLKIESYQGVFGDDSALNGLSFRCSNGEVFSSNIGHQGTWREWKACPEGELVDGVSFRSEYEQGAFRDDMAATGFMAHCSGGSWISGDGLQYGSWQTFYCSEFGNGQFCGLQTQVEAKNSITLDHTGLNMIHVECCY